MWRQSMQTKWIEPSTLCCGEVLEARPQEGGELAPDISPEAMANSRCLIAPEPPTWPSIGTL